MPDQQIIYTMGDLHADWNTLSIFIHEQIRSSATLKNMAADGAQPEVIILQCGDFGFNMDQFSFGGLVPWDYHNINNSVPWLKGGHVKIYWCDGNHENHDALDRLEAENPGSSFHEIIPGVYFASFGAVFSLRDGTNVLFCGGADSIDKSRRVKGSSWWRQETIDEADMSRLPDPAGVKIDWVISHTCPSYFQLAPSRRVELKGQDPSKKYLDKVFDMFKPKRWWFGHYHEFQEGQYNGCSWTMLDRCDAEYDGQCTQQVRPAAPE